VPLMAPVMLVTVHENVLGIGPEAKFRPGVPPLQTVAVELDVIDGLGLTVTLVELGNPLHPDAFVSLTEITTGETFPKFTVTEFKPTAVEGPTIDAAAGTTQADVEPALSGTE